MEIENKTKYPEMNTTLSGHNFLGDIVWQLI